MERDDLAYLEDILAAINRIQEYVSGINKATFQDKTLIQDAVVRQLEIIGEATKRFSSDIPEANPHVPWKLMAGMRDRLIHGYFDVNIDEVWLTVVRDLPDLRGQIVALIEELK